MVRFSTEHSPKAPALTNLRAVNVVETKPQGFGGRRMPGQLDLRTKDFWVKVVDFLIHNWAVVRVTRSGTPELIFFDDASRVFDSMAFDNIDEAVAGLRRNGFKPYVEMGEFKKVLPKPRPPFSMERMNHRPVYSSGEYWR